jgi:hypothetical protein
MKSLFLALALAPLNLFAAYDLCLFGNSSSQMLENFGHFTDKGKLQITQKNAAKFTAQDQKIILRFFKDSENEEIKVKSWSDILKALNADEVEELYIQRFQDTYTGKTYAYVWSYPGDNEYGTVYDYSTGKVVAQIGDGDMGDCTAQFSSFEKLPLPIPRYPQGAYVYREYDCYFGNDLLALARSSRFNVSNVATKNKGYYVETKALLKDKKTKRSFQLVMKQWPNGGPNESEVQSRGAGAFVLAKYKDGQAEQCAEVTN